MQDLDGVLDSDDVQPIVLVQPIDCRGQRGCLAASGGAGDKNQAAGFFGQPLYHGRKSELFEAGDLLRQHSSYGYSDRPPLLEDVGPEPPQARYAIGEIRLVGLVKYPRLLLVHEAKGDLDDVGRRQPWKVGFIECPVNPQVWWASRLDVYIRRLLLNRLSEEHLNVHLYHLSVQRLPLLQRNRTKTCNTLS